MTLRAAGLAPGDDVRVRAVAPGRLELVRADELVAEYAGVFDAGVYPKGYLDSYAASGGSRLHADVLIAFLARDGAHHSDAVERVRRALEPGTRRLVSAADCTEVLIGPLKAAGPEGAETADAMFVRFGIKTIQVDMDLRDDQPWFARERS